MEELHELHSIAITQNARQRGTAAESLLESNRNCQGYAYFFIPIDYISSRIFPHSSVAKQS